MTNGIDSMATQLAVITAEPQKPNEAKAQSIADKALRDILAQSGSMAKISLSALEVCRKIGEAAAKARAALAHGKFTPWIDANFGPDNKNDTQLTPQWIRTCMRVHEVFVRLENNKDREKIITSFGGDVKNFARILAMLEAGNNPLTFKPEKRAAKLDTGTGTGSGADAGDSDNAASAKVLQRKLDAAEKKIADLTEKLAKANATIVAQKLEISTLKDAAKAAGKRKVADVIDVEAKTKTHGADTMEQARLMMAKGNAAAKAKADKAKGVTAAKAPKAKAAKPAKATKLKAEPVDLPTIDTSDVPADLLANASSTLDNGMGANA